MRLALLMVAALGLVHAPFQCASDPDPNRKMEDTAPEALWDLSERFEKKGDEDARLEALRQIVERYPSSRYAERARLALRDAGEPVPEPEGTAGGAEGDAP